MKRILYLHGFASSGASGTVELLRREFWERADPAHRAVVTAPDIPVDPLDAWPMLEALAYEEMPDLIVGTSMGAWYAQQLHGFLRICVNPSFWLSKKYDILHVGKHKWLNRRKDGATEFHVKKETIEHFQEMRIRYSLPRRVPCSSSTTPECHAHSPADTASTRTRSRACSCRSLNPSTSSDPLGFCHSTQTHAITYQRMQKKWQIDPASTKRCQIGWW